MNTVAGRASHKQLELLEYRVFFLSFKLVELK